MLDNAVKSEKWQGRKVLRERVKSGSSFNIWGLHPSKVASSFQ